MANDNFPRGLLPLNYPFHPGHYYKVDTTNDIFIGQPVDMAATGYVTNALSVGSAGMVMALGVATGFAGPDKAGLATDDPYLDASDLGTTTLAAGLPTGDRYVFVADDPQQLFVIQGDTGATVATQADVFASFALIYRATSGNTDTGFANLEVDASSASAGTGQIVQLLQLHETMNSDGTKNAFGNYAKLVVKIFNHRLNSGQETASAI